MTPTRQLSPEADGGTASDPRGWRLDGARLLDTIRCDWQREVLGNGLTVLLHADPSTPLVHVGVGYRVGSMDEGFRQTGLAHLFEHLMFGGTKQLPGSYLTRMLEAGATGVNAMTGRDMTRYYQTVPAHLLDFTLFAEADRMGNFLQSIDTAALERERKVVLEEKKETEARPFGKLFLWLSEGLLPMGHPYRHPVIGYQADIAAFTLEDVRAWYATHYAPGNAVLVVTGGIDPDAVLEKVEHHFGHIPAGPRPQRVTARVESAIRQSAMRVVDRISAPGIFYQGWVTPSLVASPREDLALSLAVDLLAEGRSSVLHRRLVEESDLASHVSGQLLPGRALGTLFVSAPLKAPADRRIGEVISEAVAGFTEAPISEERMELVRSKRLASAVRTLVGFERKAGMLLEGEILHGDAGWFRQKAQLAAEIGEAEIRAAARTWLGAGAFQLSVDPAPVHRAASRAAPAAPPPGDPAAAVICSPEWDEATLANGMRVRVSRRPGDATFQLRLVVAGGQAVEPPGLEGLAELVAAMPAIGAGPDDSAALADRTARAGLSASMSASLTSVGLDISGLHGGLPSAVALVADTLIRPRYRTPTFERHMVSRIANAATAAGMPQQRAMNALFRALLGDQHRLARPSPVSPDLARNVGVAEVERFHMGLCRPHDLMVLVAGDVDVAAAAAMLETALEDWAATTTPALPPHLRLEPMRPGIHLFDAPGQGTVQVALAWRTRALTDVESVAFDCLGHLLGGSFTSRANMRLREEKGWTYGVQGGVGKLAPSVGPDYGSIQAAVNEAHVGEALAELEGLIEGLRGDAPPREHEIESFRRSERQRLARLNETPAQAIQTLQEMHDEGMATAEAWLDYRDRVEGLNAETLAGLARELLPARGEWACTLMGDVGRIRPLLTAAGLAGRIIDEARV